MQHRTFVHFNYRLKIMNFRLSQVTVQVLIRLWQTRSSLYQAKDMTSSSTHTKKMFAIIGLEFELCLRARKKSRNLLCCGTNDYRWRQKKKLNLILMNESHQVGSICFQMDGILTPRSQASWALQCQRQGRKLLKKASSMPSPIIHSNSLSQHQNLTTKFCFRETTASSSWVNRWHVH